MPEARNETTRPVWLTREQWEKLDAMQAGIVVRHSPALGRMLREFVVDPWLTAPADPVEAVTEALDDIYGNDYIPATICGRLAVLRALGWEAPA